MKKKISVWYRLLLPAMAILHSLIPASANFLPLPTSQPAIYIRSDGSVYPSWALFSGLEMLTF
jgi:hypothetical protein